MASENSEHDSLSVSEESSFNCDTVSPESLPSLKVERKPDNDCSVGPVISPRMSAEFGNYLDKAIAQGSRSFYGTDSEADDDHGDDGGGCNVVSMGRVAHALSEDINHRIRSRVSPCSSIPDNDECAGDESQIWDNVVLNEDPVSAEIQSSSVVKFDHTFYLLPKCEERSAQTSSHEDEVKLENKEIPEVAHTPSQSSGTVPSAERLANSEDLKKPLLDANLLKERERQLQERVRLLKVQNFYRQSSASCTESLMEQLKKIDLTLDRGIFKVCDRKLSENALATIVDAFKNNNQLTELDLSGCCIQKGDDLAEFVRTAPSLQRLLLAWNSLGAARTGVAALAFAIASSPSLQEVDLRSNQIGPATAAALALALRTNNTLKRLDLMWNEVGASGGIALLGMLEKNHSLTELGLAGNSIPCQLLGQIDSLLQRNRTRQSMTEDCSDPVVIPAICPSQCHVPACTEASSTAVSGSPSTRKAKKISQDELESLRKNLDDAKAECFDLEKQKCDAVCHLKACRAEMDKEIKRRGKAERETEEVRMEYIKLKQTELMRRKESEKAALEREAETIKEIQYLADQLALLREDSNKRIKAIETTSKNDAEYNFGVIQKLESSNSQRDQKHLEETEALRSQLQAEIDSLKSKKCNLMMEVEKQKTNTKLIEQLLANQQQVLQQEKEAIEQELKHQVSVQMVEIECLQHRLDDKDRELAKINQKHDECMQAMENDLRKERASVKRADLDKAHAEQKIASVEASMKQLKEKYKAEQQKSMLLGEKILADELKHNSSTIALNSKHSEEQEMMRRDLFQQRKQTDALLMQLKEMQAEHDRRMKDIDIQVRGAETTLVECVQQQFSALQAALNFHASVPAIEYNQQI
ncbi:uncharacterized protein [Physcomitrium patens]|uniref:uncharacterized protein isoform X2 n=1 Tax=Physcomitrium patens TaxID=3218 RepID=UPI003CCE04B8